MSETTPIVSRSVPASLRRLVVLGLLLIASIVVTSRGVARADGDPASDVLVSQHVFVPSDASATAGDQARLEAVVGAAARAGFPVRVALIGSSSDLGSVTALWRQPQNYAHFLWQELSFAVHALVLVVMPNGFGLYTGTGPTAHEQAALARTTPAHSGSGLPRVAVTAVQNIAAATGHPVPATIAVARARQGAGSGGTDTISWIVFGCGVVLIAVAWGASFRARPLRVRDRGASPT